MSRIYQKFFPALLIKAGSRTLTSYDFNSEKQSLRSLNVTPAVNKKISHLSVGLSSFKTVKQQATLAPVTH
jgi:hypothetical protein